MNIGINPCCYYIIDCFYLAHMWMTDSNASTPTEVYNGLQYAVDGGGGGSTGSYVGSPQLLRGD